MSPEPNTMPVARSPQTPEFAWDAPSRHSLSCEVEERRSSVPGVLDEYATKRSRDRRSLAGQHKRTRGLACALVCALLAAASVASAQPDKGKKDAPKGDPKKKPTGQDDKPNVIDFEGIKLSGQLRTPQLLYFLDRAAEELDRASLERRSFIPELVRSIDEEGL